MPEEKQKMPFVGIVTEHIVEPMIDYGVIDFKPKWRDMSVYLKHFLESPILRIFDIFFLPLHNENNMKQIPVRNGKTEIDQNLYDKEAEPGSGM